MIQEQKADLPYLINLPWIDQKLIICTFGQFFVALWSLVNASRNMSFTASTFWNKCRPILVQGLWRDIVIILSHQQYLWLCSSVSRVMACGARDQRFDSSFHLCEEMNQMVKDKNKTNSSNSLVFGRWLQTKIAKPGIWYSIYFSSYLNFAPWTTRLLRQRPLNSSTIWNS